MILQTERLLLRPWTDDDAESLFQYAKDPDVGPIAGWPPHKSTEESLNVIRTVLNGAGCYAICEKGEDRAIGSIELMTGSRPSRTECSGERELGYWIGKPFWGRGYMTEAARELIRRGFRELGLTTVRCTYFDGNERSKRVQEKLGFVYRTSEKVPVPFANEERTVHINYLTREAWEAQNRLPQRK